MRGGAAAAGSGRRRLRVKPLRIALFVALMAAVISGAAIAPGTPYVAVSMPGRDPLRVVPEETKASATVPLTGDCLATAIRDDGTLVATLLGTDQVLTLTAVWPDGRSIRVPALLDSRPSIVTASESYVYAWVPAAAPATTGGTVYALSVAGLGAEPAISLRPAWRAVLERTVLRMVATTGALALLTADGSGVPDELLLLRPSDGSPLVRDGASDGLWTSYAAAGIAGGVAVGGAQVVDGQLTPAVRVYNVQGDLLSEFSPREGPPYLLSLSPTGRYLLAVTHRGLDVWTSDGVPQWSRAFPAVSVLGAAVSADGRVLLGTRQNILALDARGRVARRWRGPALAAFPVGGGSDALLCVLNGGAVVLGPDGTLEAAFRWEGETQAVAFDQRYGRLWRASGEVLELFCVQGP